MADVRRLGKIGKAVYLVSKRSREYFSDYVNAEYILNELTATRDLVRIKLIPFALSLDVQRLVNERVRFFYAEYNRSVPFVP